MLFLKLAPEVQSNSFGDDFIFVLSFPKSRTSLLGIDSQSLVLSFQASWFQHGLQRSLFFPVNNKSIAAGATTYIIYSKFTSRCGRLLLFLFSQDWCASERLAAWKREKKALMFGSFTLCWKETKKTVTQAKVLAELRAIKIYNITY